MKKGTIRVQLWDASAGGDFYNGAIFYNMTAKAAMIAYLEQMRGNFNTWTYPKDLEGIYKSQAVQDRILYDLTDDITVYAQRA